MADRGPDGFRRLLEKDAASVAGLIKATGLQGK